jgi:pyrroline-5-carboxylate reductase
MLEKTRIAFIGAGAMAEAILQGLLAKKLVDPGRLIAADVRADRGRDLTERYGIQFTPDNRAALAGADVVVLAVKPQTLPTVLPELAGAVPEKALVVSIIAGARLATLCGGLSHPAAVRSMPNTPAQIGKGMTVWTASPAVSDVQRARAGELLGALGVTVYVDDERFLDAATALSGSGPAYVFLFMEALVDAGVELGFAPLVARQLVLQTIKGAAEYAGVSPLDLAQLRRQVTSPNGTTAAALASFEADDFRNAILRAVRAAYRRSLELGQAPAQPDQGKDRA